MRRLAVRLIAVSLRLFFSERLLAARAIAIA